MKVFIVTVQPFPHGMAGTGRVICYAKALIAANIKCEVLVFHRTEVYGKTPKNTKGIGVFEGIPFRYIGGTPLRAPNVFLRKFYDWKDKRSLLKYLKQNMQNGDSILTYYRQNDMDYLLLRFAENNGFPIYRDLCEYPYATSQINKETEKKCLKYMRTTFQKYTGAICISQPLLDLATKYHPNGKYIKVPIMIDEEKWNFDNVKPKKFDAPYIFHSGALFQQKDGIVDVLNAFADALPSLPKGIRYYFTGKIENSADRELIKKTIAIRKLYDNVVFLGYLSNEDLMQYIKGASLFIIYKNDNIQNRYCFATKLGEYLLSANPVITTGVGEAANYLKDGVNAYIVEAGNLVELKNAIGYAILHQAESNSIGKVGSECAKNNFCITSQCLKLKEFFSK